MPAHTTMSIARIDAFSVNQNSELQAHQPPQPQPPPPQSNTIEMATEKLGSDNYGTWKKNILQLFKQKGYYATLSSDGLDPTKITKGFALMFLSLDSENQERVKDCSTPAQIWNRLKHYYEPDNLAEARELLTRLFSYRFFTVHELVDALTDIKNIVQRLEMMGVTLDDKVIVKIILKAMPGQIRYLSYEWRALPIEEQTLANLCIRLTAKAKASVEGRPFCAKRVSSSTSPGQDDKRVRSNSERRECIDVD